MEPSTRNHELWAWFCWGIPQFGLGISGATSSHGGFVLVGSTRFVMNRLPLLLHFTASSVLHVRSQRFVRGYGSLDSKPLATQDAKVRET